MMLSILRQSQRAVNYSCSSLLSFQPHTPPGDENRPGSLQRLSSSQPHQICTNEREASALSLVQQHSPRIRITPISRTIGEIAPDLGDRG